MSDPSMEAAPRPSFLTAVKRDLFSWLQALVFALIVLIIAFTFLGRIISVEGSSMYPTLHDADMLLLQSVGYTPRQGDVVVLNKPFDGITDPIVKRIIATGGQTVRIDYSKARVYVDEVPLEEPYINETMLPPHYESLSSVSVPVGSIFVMGDNRNASSDSRDVDLGVIDSRHVLGRAVLVLFPFGSFGALAGAE